MDKKEITLYETPIPTEDEKIIINIKLLFKNNSFNLIIKKLKEDKICFIIPSKNSEEFKKYQIELTLEKLKEMNKFFKMFDTLDELEIELINIAKENGIQITEYTKNEIILNIKIFARNNNIVKIKLRKVEMNEKEKLEILNNKYNEINHINKEKDEKIKDLENSVSNALKKIELKDEKIKDLENVISNVLTKIELKDEKIQSLENDLIESKKNIINKQKEDEVLIEKYKKEINSLNEEKNKLEIVIKDYDNKIKATKMNSNIIEINNKNINLVDFYDVIVDIKSVKDICKGIEIKMNERGKNNYEKGKNEESITIGAIGNINKGKTFILSKLSRINFPTGIKTKGISVKYPEFKNKKMVLIDTMGLDEAILKEENNGQFNKKELLKEALIRELFITNYIINNSNIILIIIGELTISEQNLLNRIKTQIIKNKIDKLFLVIHNLYFFTSIKQIEEYINENLLKNESLNLEKAVGITTGRNEKNRSFYYEKDSKSRIFHLIFANGNSEAGQYYNDFSLDFIEKSFCSITYLKTFDIIKTMKERFIELSNDIFQIEKLTLNDFNSDNKTIKLQNYKNLEIKNNLIYDFGFPFFIESNKFHPKFNYYKKDNKLIISLEIPGNSKTSCSIEICEEYNIIKLKGEKKKGKFPERVEDNIFNNREFSDFSLSIPLKTTDFLLKNKSPNLSQKNGIITLEYELEEKR